MGYALVGCIMVVVATHTAVGQDQMIQAEAQL
jgi:hypothetical protein